MAKNYEDDSDEILDESEIESAADEISEEEEEDAEEIVTPRASKKRVVEEEEDEAPKRKVVSGVKSKGKEKTNVKTDKEKNHRGTAKATAKTAKVEKHAAVRASRTGDRPFGATSGIGRAFKLTEGENGIKVDKLKEFITQTLKAGMWILSFIRRGRRLDGKFAWDVEEENGRIKTSNIRKLKVNTTSAKKAA